jgi:triacylglycerol lipase
VDRFGAFAPFVGTDQALGVLNGLFGDRLEQRQSRLALPMTFRWEASDAGRAVCVFVPGLMSTNDVWRFPGRAATTYGSRLAADRGVTPVFVSYNSGRHISANGRQLAIMLEEVLAAWPVEVGELTLVGHSMGGLVSRSATHYGAVHGHAWVEKLRRVFLLGAPLSGAPLEKAVHLADRTLTIIWNPVTRLVGRALRQRSAGVKDLRFGSLVDDDWSGHDPDALRWPQRTPVPLIPTADHYVIAGTLTDRGDHPVAQVLGDPLVTGFSVRGRTLPAWAATLVPEMHLRTLPGVGHLALAHHDDVYEQMLAWWTTS